MAGLYPPDCMQENKGSKFHLVQHLVFQSGHVRCAQGSHKPWKMFWQNYRLWTWSFHLVFVGNRPLFCDMSNPLSKSSMLVTIKEVEWKQKKKKKALEKVLSSSGRGGQRGSGPHTQHSIKEKGEEQACNSAVAGITGSLQDIFTMRQATAFCMNHSYWINF